METEGLTNLHFLLMALAHTKTQGMDVQKSHDTKWTDLAQNFKAANRSHIPTQHS